MYINSFSKQYHEENAPVEIYGNERAALDSINCELQEDSLRPPTLVTVDDDSKSDVEEVRDFIAKDARRKREEQMQGDEYRTNYIDENGVLPQATSPPRGDIPSNGIETCDGKNFLEFLNYLTVLYLKKLCTENILLQIDKNKKLLNM